MKIEKPSALVDKNICPLWVLWTYVDAYQQEGTEYKGGH